VGDDLAGGVQARLRAVCDPVQEEVRRRQVAHKVQGGKVRSTTAIAFTNFGRKKLSDNFLSSNFSDNFRTIFSNPFSTNFGRKNFRTIFYPRILDKFPTKHFLEGKSINGQNTFSASPFSQKIDTILHNNRYYIIIDIT
jgi:hypothetical protein